MNEKDVAQASTTLVSSSRLQRQLLTHMDKSILNREVWQRNTSLERSETFHHITRCSQLRRKLLINDTCHRYNLTSRDLEPKDYWRLLVNRKLGLVYCSIPKAGCTTLRAMIRDPEATRRHLSAAKKTKIWKDRLDGYKKLLVVRHPFSRLYSAYYDKIYLGSLTHPKFYLGISERYFPGSTAAGKLEISFAQFAKLVAYEYETGAFFNRHWMTQYELCRPCQIRYDYVAKLETMKTDEPTIRVLTRSGQPMRRLNAHGSVRDLRSLQSVYRDVSEDVIERLLQIYEADFRLFGYSWTAANAAACTDTPNQPVSQAPDKDCCS